MRAATRRNLVFAALGAAMLALLWQLPGRAPAPSSAGGLSARPTATVVSHWEPLMKVEASGPRDLCREGRTVTVPGPWRVRADPAEGSVQVRVIEPQSGRLFARVWAAGEGRGALPTLPQGNGTYCLQVEASGAYTLWVEAWQAPEG